MFTPVQPVRSAGLLFAGMVALFAACAPFIEGVDPGVFVLGGAAYSLLLALFGVGLGLALPSRLVLWWLLLGVLPLLVNSGAWLAVRFDPEFLVRAPAAVSRGLLGVLWVWLLAGCAVAGWGWVRYLRGHRSASRGWK